MARVSSASADAFHFKGNFEEGWGKVTSARAIVFQFPPSKEASADGSRAAGWQDPPQLVAELMIQRYTDGEGTRAASQEEQVLLSIQKPDKQTGELSSCHPGNFADDNPDSDPTDAGGSLGAEGNTLYALQDGFQLNDKCKWMVFCASLEEKGFKPDVLKRSFFDDLVGLYAFFKNVTKKGSSAQYDASYFVADKIAQYPYEKGAQQGKGKPAARAAAPKPAATAKPAAAAAPATSAPKTNGAADTTAVEEIARAVVLETFSKKKNGAVLSDYKKVRIEALMCVSGHKPAVPAELKKAVNDYLTEDFMQEFGEAMGVLTAQADGSLIVSAYEG